MEQIRQLIQDICRVVLFHQSPTYGDALRIHLEISGLALLIGLLIALPLAVIASQSPLASVITVNVSNFGRAVPSLAVLAIAMPILGLGFTPALLALIVLAIPPIVINASVALQEVDQSAIDSARGMGLSRWQVLTRTRIPIAMPIIFAGIRTSAVQVVASATLATFIGGGGLGDFIVEGFTTPQVIVQGQTLSGVAVELTGALSVALLALFTEIVFGILERVSTPRGLRIGRGTKPA